MSLSPFSIFFFQRRVNEPGGSNFFDLSDTRAFEGNVDRIQRYFNGNPWPSLEPVVVVVVVVFEPLQSSQDLVTFYTCLSPTKRLLD